MPCPHVILNLRAFKSAPKFMAAFNRFGGNAHIWHRAPSTTGVTLNIFYTVAGTYEATWIACGN